MSERDIDEMGRGMFAELIKRRDEDPVKYWDPISEAIIKDIEAGGPIGRALERAYNLKRQSV